jgi:4-hydroxy-3-polyprenylbenzoate decarboxylase
MKRLVVGVSGASGAILALHLIEQINLLIDLVITPEALYTARYEIAPDITTGKKFISHLTLEAQKRVTIHPHRDIGASIASGSHETIGMVILPCSLATVAAIAAGLGDNCLRRAADVTIKEKRPLILVPRESPLSEIHLENLLKLARCGATIVPPVPAWYTQPQTVRDMEMFIVGKVLDALKLPHDLYPRWKKVSDDGADDHA